MTKILTPQTKNLEPSNQVTNKDEKIFEKEEYQAIYRAFLDTLKNPENLEKQTKQEIEKKKQKLKEELSDKEKQKLHRDLESLNKQLKRLQNGNEKKIFTFVFENREEIFKNINQKDIKLLSEENFLQFLLSVFEKIREKNLASEEKLNNDKIQQIITKCVVDIRGTEARDWVVDSVKRKIPGRKLLEKIPGLGKVLGVKKEEDEPPLSDEEMVTTFLHKSLFPIIALTTVILLGGLSGPVPVLGLFTIPHVIVIGFAIFGFAAAEYKAVKSLFSNDKKGTLYDPHSRDEKERKEWGNEISDGINTILETPVKRVEKGTPVSEQNSQGNNRENEESKQSTVLEQVTLDQPAKSTGQQP